MPSHAAITATKETKPSSKYTVSTPGDKYEQEADRVAELVTRDGGHYAGGLSTGTPPPIQTKCAACASGGAPCPACGANDQRIQRQSEEEEELVQTKPMSGGSFLQCRVGEEEEGDLLQRQTEVKEEKDEALVQRQPEIEEEGDLLQRQPKNEEDEMLQMKESSSAGAPGVSKSVAGRIDGLRGGGEALSASTRAYFEPRFGRDFSGVRVHRGSGTSDVARSLNARAFTVGRDIAFGEGEYAPEASGGRRLLAHELTHVVQQRQRSIPSLVQRQNGGSSLLSVSHDDRLAVIAELAQRIAHERGELHKTQSKISGLPAVSSESVDAQRETMRAGVKTAEERIKGLLTERIVRLKEAIATLHTALPGAEAEYSPSAESVNEVQMEIERLRVQLRQAERELLTLERGMARREIEEIDAELAGLPGSSQERAWLEERKLALSEFLSGTAENRTAPGTYGHLADGRGYVVYQHSVRVGGSLPWRNKNPGNVQSSASGGDPLGVLGVDQFEHYIFDNEESGKMAVFFDLENRRGGPGVTLEVALRRYIAGNKKDKELPDTKEDCKPLKIAPAVCVTKEAANTYAPKVTGIARLGVQRELGELTPTEKIQLAYAILFWEGGTNAKQGDEYTCANLLAPQEYRDLLGCDE